MMRAGPPPADPDSYVGSLTGWQREKVDLLRAAVRSAAELEERIKWGHLVYFANGPVLLIRAEESRVLFGFWRGKRLLDIEPRLKASGKYELATMVIGEDTSLDPALAGRLATAAVVLNQRLGNPTVLA